LTQKPSGPAFEVHIDERALADDLNRASDAARAAIEPMIQSLRVGGAPTAWLKRCDAEARDGTRLPGCVKLYIPQPADDCIDETARDVSTSRQPLSSFTSLTSTW
jgi:hypothetical protein